MSKKTKSIKTKPDEEIKKEFKKIILHPYKGEGGDNDALLAIDTALKTAAGTTVALVPRVANNVGFNFETKYIPFMYFRREDEQADLNPTIREYFNDLKQRFRVALGIPDSLKNLQDIIEVIDRPQNAQANNNDWMQGVPRYKKMMKLKEVYELLIKFTLELIHKFYWVNFLKRNPAAGNFVSAEQIPNIHNINHYVERVIPISLQLKKLLEQEVENDFPTDIVDLQFSKGQKF